MADSTGTCPLSSPPDERGGSASSRRASSISRGRRSTAPTWTAIEGTAWLVSNPAAAVEALRKKAGDRILGVRLRLSARQRAGGHSRNRRPVDQVDLETSWVTWLHVALSLAGLSIALRNRIARLLLCPLLTLVVSTLLFFGYVRLGVAYLPTIWILQGLAIGAVLRRIPVRTLARAELAIAGLAAALLFYDYTRVAQARPLMIDGIVDETGRLVEDQPLTIERVR